MDGDSDGAPGSVKPAYNKDASSCASHDSGDGVDSRTPRKSSNRTSRGGDLSGVDMKTSWDGSAVSTGSSKAGMLADPVKIAKEREKEERVRQARERLAEERRRKLEELREQQRIAQENREKQLEMRRKKIEDLRRRDVERRAAVEERRKMKEELERARRESILQKAEERVARYEAWKAGGRKGGRGHLLGFGSGTPRDICLPFERPRRSSSHSALQRLSPNGSDMDSVRPQRRALSACSAVRRRHCCTVDSNKMGGYQYPRQSLGSAAGRSAMTTSMPSPVRLREKAPRKQRPASVASSMPSFVGGEPAKSPRSKSTDRAARDRSKSRPMKEKVSKDLDAKGSDKPDGDEKQTKKGRVSLSIFDRLATPKFQKASAEANKDQATPKKDAPIIRRSSLREKPSPSTKQTSGGKSSTPTTPSSTPRPARPSTARSTPDTSKPLVSPERVASPARAASPAGVKVNSGSSTPRRVTPPPVVTATPPAPVAASATPSGGPATPAEKVPDKVSEDGTPTPRAQQDITAEEYKARLAEKRRQAREKAEREAEEERKRLEEERLAEEQRQREEEEEQRRQEEESLRLAEQARRQEEERLQKAIEAEEKRKREEAERLEQEKKAREEADRKAKLEAERLEKEKQERAKREEEERLQRKKKLEMIMKRVKPDASPASESPVKTEQASETPVKAEVPDVKPVSQDVKPFDTADNVSKVDGQDRNGEPPQRSVDSPVPATVGGEGEAVEMPTGNGSHDNLSSVQTGQTMSASIAGQSLSSFETGSMVETTQVVRSASSGDIVDSAVETTPVKPLAEEVDGKPKFKSPLLQQLVEKKGGGGGDGSPKFKSPLLQNLLGKTKVGARMGLSHSMGDLSGEASKESSKQGLEEDKDEDTLESTTRTASSTTTSTTITSTSSQGPDMNDSALGLSLGPTQASEGASLYNGHHQTVMEDSSISLHSVDSERYESQSGGQFEELIDLLDGAKAPGSSPHPPIIAFDENRRTDVTESLS